LAKPAIGSPKRGLSQSSKLPVLALRGAARIRPDDRRHSMTQPAEDTIYISMCSGGAMVKVSAAERAQFILGQITILGLAMVVTLVELAIWLARDS
jgi:hypothetical protein